MAAGWNKCYSSIGGSSSKFSLSMGVWWLLTAHVPCLLALCVVWRGGQEKQSGCVRVHENKTRKLRSWSESIKMPLFEYKFYRKLQEGGIARVLYSSVSDQTRSVTRSVVQTRDTA